jgi:hypothetical protein
MPRSLKKGPLILDTIADVTNRTTGELSTFREGIKTISEEDRKLAREIEETMSKLKVEGEPKIEYEISNFDKWFYWAMGAIWASSVWILILLTWWLLTK